MKRILTLIMIFIVTMGTAFAATDEQIRQRIQDVSVQITTLRQQLAEAGSKGDIVRVREIEKRHNDLVKEKRGLENQLKYGPNGSFAGDMKARIEFFNKMKTCQPASVQTLMFTETISGKQNGYCTYKFALRSGKAYTICRFPMSVAQKFATESIKGASQGIDLPTTRAIINNPKYCKDYMNY